MKYKHGKNQLIQTICTLYDLGGYKSYRSISMGFEDKSVKLISEKGIYYIKIFNTLRTDSECSEYISKIIKVLQKGICHPKLIGKDNSYLQKVIYNDKKLRLCVMEYIDGNTYYELETKPSFQELKFLIREISKIHSIHMLARDTYDPWALVNFLNEYKDKERYLSENDRKMISPLLLKFSKYPFQKLPKMFVHGDLISTNIIKEKNGRIHIVDFSNSSYYPRIQEFSVLLCDLLFDRNHPSSLKEDVVFLLHEYSRYLPVTNNEVKDLPFFVMVTHAINILQHNYLEKVNKNITIENKYWLATGRQGIEQAYSMWGMS